MTVQLAQADTADDAVSEPADPAAPAAEEVEVPIPAEGTEGVEGVEVPVAEGESLFPPFDMDAYPSHLFWIVISFGVLLFFVNRLVVPQVGGILEDRRDRIASDLGEASRLSRETDEVIAIYERELAEARQRAQSIAQERREEVKAEQERQQAETEEQLQERIAKAEREIASRRDAALADVDTIATEVAASIVERIAGITVSESESAEAVRKAEAARA